MSSEIKTKALEKGKSPRKQHENTYSFLTKDSFRIDSKARNRHEAYDKLKQHHDKLSGTYFKYDKEGLHANDGPYSQYKPRKK